MTTTNDVLHLIQLYGDRIPLQGEMHDHGATGGTSDGKRPLSHWVGALEALDMDFAAILDHKQVRHMYLPEWNDALFLCGSEPGTNISDSKAVKKGMHYNLLTPSAAALEELLSEFPEYQFEGGSEGHFIYPRFTTERFGELIDALKAKGGFFVHPHPSSVMQSDDPLDYWFRDETGLEVFYAGIDNRETRENYEIWTGLLARDKRVWAIAGGDGHAVCSDRALTTLYCEEKTNASILTHLREGDFTCGPVGMRMCVGDTRMGSMCSFLKNRLVLSVGDFHRSVIRMENQYRVDILSDEGVEMSRAITPTETAFFALPTANKKFYRAEVWDVTRNLRIGIGNPIWNTDRMEAAE